MYRSNILNLRSLRRILLPGIISLAALVASRPAFSDTHDKILGGAYTSVNSPMAFILSKYASCSGAVVGGKVILTARHCLSAFGKSAIVATINHQNYTVTELYGGPYDLALLKVSRPIAVPRLSIRKNSFPRVGQTLAVLGFGNPQPGYLKYTYMQVAGYESAGSFVARSIDGSTTCSGDSGGPAIVNDNGRPLVIGVVSRGQSACGRYSATAFGATGSTLGYNWLAGTLARIDH